MHQGKAIRVTTDVPYAYSPIIPAEELSLDLYVPEGARSAPILVYLHGGGWIGGNKNGIGPKAMTFAASGMIVASVNCRLAPVRPAPNACSDIAEAIAQTPPHGGRDWRGRRSFGADGPLGRGTSGRADGVR